MTRAAKRAPAASSADRFARRVLAVVTRIPPGRVCTYGDVAQMAGAPGAARAVGNVLAHARAPGVPYHRVIAAAGRLGGYSDLATKRALLAAEGLEVTRAAVRHFNEVRWPGRRGKR
jgi:O-6-methylguanine DNA methyltransferase